MTSGLMQGVEYSHFLFEKHLGSGDRVVDATTGNGHDTLFLAHLVGKQGQVWGFDIQKKAIEETKKKIKAGGLQDRVQLIHDGHENLAQYVTSPVDGILFNLGYLPGSRKKVVTNPETTLQALKSGLNLLAPDGLVVLVVYTGHEGGKAENRALLKYCTTLDENRYNVLYYHFLNQVKSPARVLAIKHRSQE
ncbi:MAG: class I SAM-dependent methyltransferase [Bacillota bacterium]